jgi:uncharacterized protein YggE
LPQFLTTETIGPPAEKLDLNQPLVEVKGEGVQYAPPDIMEVSFGVRAHAAAQAECSATASSIASRVTAAERAELGALAEISTAYVQVNTEFGTPSQSAASTPTPSLLGWKFKAKVRASANSIEMMPPLVEAGLAAGASEVWRSGFVYFGRDQHGEGASVGNIFTPGRVLPLPPDSEKQIPYILLSVEADGKTADECVRKGAPIGAHVARVLADQLGSRGAAGIEEYQVQRIEPQPQYTSQSPAVSVQQGFSATTSVSVKTRELNKLPAILEAGAAAGAAWVQIGYSVTADSQARTDAIARAREDARDKAEATARAVRMRLGKSYRIVIETSVPPKYIYGLSLAGVGSVSTAQTDAESLWHAAVQVRVNMSVTYRLE